MSLRDAIDQDVFKIDGGEYTDADFQAMSVDGLETMKLRISKVIGGITAAIAEKKLDYADGGEGFLRDWYTRHRAALSINQRVLTYVNYLIKKNRRTLSDYFMNAAKTVLSKDEYERVLSEARNEKRIQEGY